MFNLQTYVYEKCQNSFGYGRFELEIFRDNVSAIYVKLQRNTDAYVSTGHC